MRSPSGSSWTTQASMPPSPLLSPPSALNRQTSPPASWRQWRVEGTNRFWRSSWGGRGLPQGIAELDEAGIPAYRFPESAARALAAMHRHRVLG